MLLGAVKAQSLILYLIRVSFLHPMERRGRWFGFDSCMEFSTRASLSLEWIISQPRVGSDSCIRSGEPAGDSEQDLEKDQNLMRSFNKHSQCIFGNKWLMRYNHLHLHTRAGGGGGIYDRSIVLSRSDGNIDDGPPVVYTRREEAKGRIFGLGWCKVRGIR